MATKDVIDFLKDKGGFNSLKDLADAAGIDQTRMKNLRKSHTRISVEEETRLAAACGLPTMAVIALFEADREPEKAGYWKRFSEGFRWPRKTLNRAFSFA